MRVPNLILVLGALRGRGTQGGAVGGGCLLVWLLWGKDADGDSLNGLLVAAGRRLCRWRGE
jgi:hypothetical protein